VPADLLLPAFALTLALNAIFVGIALRALRNGNRDAAAVRSRSRHRENPASPPPALERVPVEWSVGPVPAAVAAVAAVEARPAANAVIDPATAARGGATPPAALDVPDRGPSGTTRSRPRSDAPAKPTGRRRRFSLPPVEDHEKVNRSIETFLAGSDVSTSGQPASPGPGSSSTVVTVAVVALVGRPATVLPPDAPAWRPPVELRALLERTVRSTARATDSVAVDRNGRVRVVLSGTGELAAHAYLRRIRAVVEPIAEAADPPVRVAIATATNLDGAVEAARRRAERRLAALLEATDPATVPEQAEDLADRLEPRAAGD